MAIFIAAPGVITAPRRFDFIPSGSPAAWFSADTITGLNDGDRIPTWPDLTVNGKDMTQAVDGFRPLYKKRIKSGLPAVHYSERDNIMATSGMTLTQPNTMFIACQILDSNTTGEIWDGVGARQIFQIATGPVWSMYAGSFTHSDDTPNGDDHVFTVIYNGANSKIRQDGVEIHTGNAGAGGLGDITLGRGGPSSCLMYVYELVIYNSAESVAANEAGLNAKWSIY